MNMKEKFEEELRRLKQQRKTAKYYAVFIDETIEELQRVLI